MVFIIIGSGPCNPDLVGGFDHVNVLHLQS